MAEIRIQEKKKPVWPWILLILILLVAAVLLYMYLTRDQNNNGDYETAPADTTTYYQGDTTLQGGTGMQPGDEVDQFTDFTSADTTSFSKQYVADGLNLLSGAVNNVVTNSDTADNITTASADSLMSISQSLTDTTDRAFSRKVSRSFAAVYEVLKNMQNKNFPDLDKQVNELRSTYRSFNADKKIETQEKTIKDFFRISGSILSNMKNTPQTI